jgi:hypothetical protein
MRSFFRSISLRALAIGCSFAVASPLLAAVPRLPPSDTCGSEPGFADFKARLTNVIAQQDARALLAMLSDDVTVNFGGGRGRDAFAAFWKIQGDSTSPVWKELEQALARGCARDGDALIAPSFLADLPDQFDSFETAIILPGTRLRAGKGVKTALKGPVLDWALANVLDDEGEHWIEVAVPGGPRGFVSRGRTASLLGYRLNFKQRGGRWLITAFVAGD